MSFLFVLFLVLFLSYSSNLILRLILLEILRFILLYLFIHEFGGLLSMDFLVLSFFRVFVIEGVIALSGLILLVSHTGSDYIRSSSFLK